MSKASTIINHAAWVWKAVQTMDRVRDLIRQEMETTDQSWPIWIYGAAVGFPGDDAVAPRAAANDRVLTFR